MVVAFAVVFGCPVLVIAEVVGGPIVVVFVVMFGSPIVVVICPEVAVAVG